MKAARWHGRRDIRIEHVPVPTPKQNEALLRVQAVGICGTDLGEYLSGPLEVPTYTPHPLTGVRAPLTLGHEIVATVESAAVDGTGYPAGTLVIPDTQLGCGTCWWCVRHEAGLCARQAVIGLHQDGGLAQYMAVKAATLLPIPDGLAAEHAVFAEPLSCAVRAVRKVATDVIGSTCLVQGAGTLGLLVSRVAAAAGATRVIVSDTSTSRLSMAVAFGATDVIPAPDVDGFLERLPEPGVDLVFECSGAVGLASTALRRVRCGGTVVAVGIHGQPESINLFATIVGERRLLGSAGHVWDSDVATALDYISHGIVQPAPLMSAIIPLDEVVTSGLDRLAAPDSDTFKIIVRPNQ